MRTTIAGIVLAGCAAAAPLAHAALEVDATGFFLGLTDGYYPELTGFDMQLLSDNGISVQIGLSGAGPLLNPVQVTATEYEYANGDYGWTQLGGKVKQGYRITSMTLSSVFSGSLEPGQPDTACGANCISQPGVVTNAASITWLVTADGDVTTDLGQLENVTAPEVLARTVTRGLDGDFTLDINSVLGVYARAAQSSIYHNVGGDFEWIEERFWTSQGSLGLDGMTLTVRIAPVPEPATWALLLAGLGLVGFTARCRQRQYANDARHDMAR